ncbi:MAG: MlaE family lipid ABC transporter permease subunit [Betaproteobacteria bacterium]
MKPTPVAPASLAQPAPGQLVLGGAWTALGTSDLGNRPLGAVDVPGRSELVVDGSGVVALDTIGARILQHLIARLRDEGHGVQMRGWSERNARLLELAAERPPPAPPTAPSPGFAHRIGRSTVEFGTTSLALLAFIGEVAVALAASIANPRRIRWKPILYNIRTTGFDALPIVGLLSLLLGIVISYQAGTQLRTYGADIFVADLVGLSMLREFAPLMTAIIVAGRSGSAFAAQIGTMTVTEEIDAMRTLGMSPMQVLVLPKIIALVIALPLLSFFADVMGIYGGMLMARAQLGMGFGSFFDRLTDAVSATSYMIGIGKAPVFAAIIAVIGCFQGFRTRGGADSVGRQTTRSVVQSIFLVIVADALFSIVFAMLDL